MKSAFRMFLMSAMAVACTGLASAAPIVAYSDPTGAGNQAYPGTLGMDFVVNSPTGINVYSVGVYDSGQNGFSRAMTVQLYSLANTSAPVFSMSLPAGTSGTLVGGDRFFTLNAPFFLAPGSYSIVADGFSASDPNGNSLVSCVNFPTLNNGGGLISFTGTSRFGLPGVFPVVADGATAKYGAGTFTYDKAAVVIQDGAVPEPGSMLLMGMGLAAVGLMSRRIAS